jgi:hypothetical protein
MGLRNIIMTSPLISAFLLHRHLHSIHRWINESSHLDQGEKGWTVGDGEMQVARHSAVQAAVFYEPILCYFDTDTRLFFDEFERLHYRESLMAGDLDVMSSILISAFKGTPSEILRCPHRQ